MRNFILILFFLCLLLGVNAQSVGINTNTPNASAALDVVSTTQGVLVPRMTQAQRTTISSPATGLLVYQTDAPSGFYFYDGSAWTSLSGGSSSLPSQSGNNGKYLTTDGTNASWAAVSGGGASLQLMVNATDAVVYPASAITTVDYGTPSVNVGSQFNTTTENFTVTANGLYHINACLSWNTSSGGIIGIYVNGTLKLMEAQTSTGAGTNIAPFNRVSATVAGILSLNAGDIVKIQFNTNAVTTTAIANLSQYTIVKLN